MCFAIAQPLAAVCLVVVAQVVFFVEELLLFDAVSDPLCLVDVAEEEVLWSERICEELHLVCEALMELRQHSSVFLNQSSQVLLLAVVVVGVWNIED